MFISFWNSDSYIEKMFTFYVICKMNYYNIIRKLINFDWYLNCAMIIESHITYGT